MNRSCARPTCSAAAVATLSYDYANRIAWIEALLDEPHPACHDLCARHANRLSPPNGWRLEVTRPTERFTSGVR